MSLFHLRFAWHKMCKETYRFLYFIYEWASLILHVNKPPSKATTETIDEIKNSKEKSGCSTYA